MEFDADTWRSAGPGKPRRALVDDLLSKYDLENWDRSRIEALRGSSDKEFLRSFPDADIAYYLGPANERADKMGSLLLLFIKPNGKEISTKNYRIGSKYLVYLCDTTSMCD
ncbi:MAG: hypothetical protein U1G05_14385 [Kiritimatiellia bacterium]